MFENTDWKIISAEFLGTFFLVFFGVTSFLTFNSGEMMLEGTITLALTLLVLVHILGPVSGCHLNPVITIPIILSGKMTKDDGVAYIFAQIIGATIAFIIFKEVKPSVDSTDLDLLIIAMIGTAFFVASLLTSQDPVSIGSTLFIVTITAFGDVNPGVSLGNMFALAIDGEAAWAFYGIIGSVIGCFLGWQIKENVMDN